MFKLFLAFLAGMIVMDAYYAYRNGHLPCFLRQTFNHFFKSGNK